jgi:hypothetical protein
MSAAALMPIPFPKRAPSPEPNALATREVDNLVWKLLDEIKIPFDSMGSRLIHQAADLKRVLSTDYMEVPALPEKPLLKELSRLVDTDIKAYTARWQAMLDNTNGEQFRDYLGKIFGPRELEIRAERYTKGAGLSLRGFFCRANMGDRSKFVIFVNTAHAKGAQAATFGHELGHYIYGSMVGEKAPMTAFMEGAFSNHLNEADELFADSLVALSAYTPEMMQQIGVITSVKSGSTDDLFNRIKKAYDLLIGPNYNLDLKKGKLASTWRVRYLTSMTHFFKLRCALYRSSGL